MTNNHDVDEQTWQAAEEVADKAITNTVTPETLLGEETYYHNVLRHIRANEQPHFVFPLTCGIGADPSLIVESGGQPQPLIDGATGGSLVLTDRYVRVHSDAGEWTIPYRTILSADRNGHPGFRITTQNKTYTILIAGTLFDFTEEVALGIEFIREAVRDAQSTSNQTDDTSDNSNTALDPHETLQKLKEMYEQDLITDEEYQKKRQEALDRI